VTTLDVTRLEASLLEALSADTVSRDVAAYTVDGAEPALVTNAQSQADVAAILAVAAANDTAVIPWGGRTQMGLGVPPARYDLALDLRGLDRIVEYEPADLTVTVEAGMALSKLRGVLVERGQWLPLDPPVSEAATLGGVLATNASGPARIAYGSARDLLIGISFATAQGELVKAGGRVVKNVAGYDLGKLQIGALGTLGVIVQASFKVAPLPPAVQVLSASSTDLPSLLGASFAVRDTALPATAIVLSRDANDSRWTLAVRFAGGTAAVDRAQRELLAIGAANHLSFDNVGPDLSARPKELGGLDDTIVVRLSVLPSTIGAMLERLAATGATVEAYATAGVARAAWPEAAIGADVIAALRQLCIQSGQGALVVEAAPAELKRQVDVWGETRGDFGLMRALKAEFDPKCVLNPGRFVGGL
jgi:glycolate oxidase FAD binding subunit